MKRYRAIFLALAVILFVVVGCDQDKKPESPESSASPALGNDTSKPEIEAAITWYNALLAQGYRDLSMNSLVQLATEKLATKAYYHMASLGEAGLKMDATLKKIDFGEMKDAGPDKVEVPTKEVWDYIYWEIKTGKRLFDNTVNYRLIYQLEKQSGRWLVTDIMVRQANETKDSSFIFKRPADMPPGESTKQEGH